MCPRLFDQPPDRPPRERSRFRNKLNECLFLNLVANRPQYHPAPGRRAGGLRRWRRMGPDGVGSPASLIRFGGHRSHTALKRAGVSCGRRVVLRARQIVAAVFYSADRLPAAQGGADPPQQFTSSTPGSRCSSSQRCMCGGAGRRRSCNPCTARWPCSPN